MIRPLVPERELAECQQRALRLLMERDPAHVWGDYLEFGVYQGHSLSIMYRTLAEFELLDRVRLYGFDSFQGYPKEAADERENVFQPGHDKAELRVAQNVLNERGVDWGRVKLIEGWFAETLTPELRQRENISRVSLVNFDCDLYISTAQALAFVAPLVHTAAIFFFDDWGAGEELQNQKRAFAEFLDVNPELHALEIPNYSWESRVFLVYRQPGQLLPWQSRMKLEGRSTTSAEPLTA